MAEDEYTARNDKLYSASVDLTPLNRVKSLFHIGRIADGFLLLSKGTYPSLRRQFASRGKDEPFA